MIDQFLLCVKKSFSPVNPSLVPRPPGCPQPCSIAQIPPKNGTASSGGSPSPAGWLWCPCCPGAAGGRMILTPVSMVSPHLHRMLLRNRSCWQENKREMSLRGGKKGGLRRGGRPGGPPPRLRGADVIPFPRKSGVSVPFPSHPHGDAAHRPPAHPRAGKAWKFGHPPSRLGTKSRFLGSKVVWA